MDDYRQHLIETYEQLSIGYARTLITLAGGALAISMAFVREMIGPDIGSYRGLLIGAWILWGISLCAVLTGYFVGRQAARRAIRQYDDGKLEGENRERAGGAWAVLVDALGIASLLNFAAGLFIFVAYVYKSWGAS